MTVERIGVHASVERVFPPAELRRTLAGDPVTDGVAVDVVDGERPAVDALVTLEYHPGFLDAAPEWIHSIQSGTDRFPYDRLAAHGVALTSSRGIHRDWIGETVAGYLLSFAAGSTGSPATRPAARGSGSPGTARSRSPANDSVSSAWGRSGGASPSGPRGWTSA
jgi:hypothetical protein